MDTVIYPLPAGGSTSSKEEHITAWRKLGELIEQETWATLIEIDNGLVFEYKRPQRNGEIMFERGCVMSFKFAKALYRSLFDSRKREDKIK